MTPSEQLVFDLCSKSFLSLWTYANPQRPNGKELCDVLLVFGDRIVLFSVKESVLKKSADPEVAARRWLRTAVDASIDQLLGAKRQLATMTHVIRADGSNGIHLSPADSRRVHLVAVAAGGDRSVPFSGGERSADAYVHVVDEFNFRELLGELDTVSDFLHYLEAKEAFKGTIVCEGEDNLLAIYLHQGRRLPDEVHLLIVEDGLWKKVQKKPEFRARKEEDRVSYWWDDLVERFIDDYRIEPERGPSLSDHERVVRTMAAEDRLARRALSCAFLDWLHRKQAGARNLVSPSNVAYVFATYPRDLPREERVKDLMARGIVARSPSMTGRETVVGLGTEVYDPSGFSFDVVYIHQPEWTSEDEEVAKLAREGFQIMQEPTAQRLSIDEFPRSTSRAEKNRKKRERRSRR
ncbi:NERD domain-containing protein [Sorangium sp. So ce1097]|uniref:NERD domain-containing protein n=1 Tax=Sorangium sp. So ce1097 TaxID=3133330 RepID=UPI003F5D613D